MMRNRSSIRWLGAAVVLYAAGLCLAFDASEEVPKEAAAMHGMIGKLTAAEGKRDELIAILLAGTQDMPGCLSYVIAKDPTDPNAVWITEVWDSAESHRASLMLPAVQDAIKKGKPFIARFDQSTATQPVGGHGLPQPKAR